MRLTELIIGENDRIIADAEFDYFGLLRSDSVGNLLTFLANKTFIPQLENKKIRCIICKEEFVSLLPDHIKGIIVSENPMSLFWELHNSIGNNRCLHDTVIGSGCAISPLASIASQNVVIGDNVLIEDFVSIKENVRLGNNVIIRSGSVIGGVGFEVKKINNNMQTANHFGGVMIEDDVEIQQLTTVDKAVFSWDNTVIGKGTKIADMVLVAHCCKVGRDCLLAGRSTLCGSVKIKDNVWIGPSATVTDSLTIGQGSYVALGSIVRKSVDANKAVINDKVISVSVLDAVKNMEKSNEK